MQAQAQAEASMPELADFDFIIGRWNVRHRRLKLRLQGCTEWEEFPGTSEFWKLMDGQGNVDDNWLGLPSGPYRAATVRVFDPATRQWAIWWLDSRYPANLDSPMRGRFNQDGVGLFLADDQLEGRAIRVRFLWTHSGPNAARWEQAFSTDGGESWEVNWVMTFERLA